MKFIEFEQFDAHIASLTVNRPEVRNALHWQAMEEFAQVIKGLRENQNTRVLLIKGEGTAFISGADLGLIVSLDSKEDGERLSTVMGDTLAEMRALPLLTIAIINGPARGGGAEIAVSCDLRFMTRGATIGFVQTSLGLIPGWGGAHRLYDLVGYSKALEYLATAKPISSEEALQVGLVNAVFPEDEFDDEVHSLTQRMASNSWEAIKSLKELFLTWESEGAGKRLFDERDRFIDLWTKAERRERLA